MVTTSLNHLQNSSDKGMSVNVALCGSIPRSSLSVGAPCRLAQDRRADQSRCTNSNLTLCSEQLMASQTHNNENMRPVEQPLTQVFDAPSWAVPAPGEARLEASNQKRTPFCVADISSHIQTIACFYSLFVKSMAANMRLT